MSSTFSELIARGIVGWSYVRGQSSIRHRVHQGTTRSSRTEYIRGRNSRSEYGPHPVLIQNRDLGYQYHLDLESRVYTAFELNEYRRLGWFARRVHRPRPSGRTVHVRTETIDTAERKEMFGYTARRVIIRTSYRYTPDDESRSQDSETDGWYIDHPAWFAVHPPLRGHAILQVAVNGKTDTPVFTDIGPRETGFLLLATRIHRSNLKDEEGNIRTYTSEDRDEVIEFSEEPLATDCSSRLGYPSVPEVSSSAQLRRQAGTSHSSEFRDPG